MKSCVTCDIALDVGEGEPVLGTFLEANHLLVSDVLERCLIMTDVTKLDSDAICSKCLSLLEEYCQIEIKYRELRNFMWKMHIDTLQKRDVDICAMIHGVEVQTEVKPEDFVIEVVQDVNDLSHEDNESHLDENITVDADPQYESDGEEESPTTNAPKQNEFPCKSCGLLLYSEKALHDHQVSSRHLEDQAESDKEDENSEEDMKLKCSACQRSIINFNALRKHVAARHQNHKILYKCRTCYKELTTHGGATYHGRSHYVGGDEPSIEEIFEFVVQKSISVPEPPKKQRPYSSISPIKLNLASKNNKPIKPIKISKRAVVIKEEIKEELIIKDELEDDDSSDDELPLATQRKQFIFEKIKEEVFTQTQPKVPTNKTAKKALAELKKINGIVIEKVNSKRDVGSKPARKERFDNTVHFSKPKKTPNEHGSKVIARPSESGDEGVKEIRLPPIKEAKYECEFCQKKWRSRGELNAHISTHSDARPFICEMCGQAYKHKHALDVHVGMHKGIYHHQCPYCQKAFTQKGALQRHLPIHTGELPFQCELCGKRFVHRTSFSIHTMAHTGVRNIKCQVCNLGVLSKSHLRRHMRIHSGEKPYECGVCGKSFAERYNLVAHRRTHDPLSVPPRTQKRKQHVCQLCNSFFSNKQKLEEHIVTDHKTTDDNAPSRPSIFETPEAYLPTLPSRFAINEPECEKPSMLRADEGRQAEPTTEQLTRRNIQALRNVDLLRASVDGQLVRLSAGMMEPSHAWAYLNHAS